MIRLLWLLCAAGLAAQEVEVYDLLLKGGHVIDPRNKRDERLDIAISKGRIRKIAKSIPAAQCRKVVEVGDYYVTPGLVDINANFDVRTGSAGVNPDHNSLRAGVTTAVDAGSFDAASFGEFLTKVVAPSKTRVLAFVKPGGGAAFLGKNANSIVGIRVPPGQPLEPALREAAAAKTIVMADYQPGLALRPGDIATRLYRTAAPSGNSKGVVLDAGHGAAGFWFRVAAPAVKKGAFPDTLSTGMDKASLMLPRATMTNVMTKFLALGMPLGQVIERSTAAPARAIRRTDIGSLEEGGVADVAVLELRTGRFGLLDSGHGKLTTDKELRCVLTVRNGAVVWDSEGLSVTHWRDAGPYSNFK